MKNKTVYFAFYKSTKLADRRKKNIPENYVTIWQRYPETFKTHKEASSMMKAECCDGSEYSIYEGKLIEDENGVIN